MNVVKAKYPFDGQGMVMAKGEVSRPMFSLKFIINCLEFM